VKDGEWVGEWAGTEGSVVFWPFWLSSVSLSSCTGAKIREPESDTDFWGGVIEILLGCEGMSQCSNAPAARISSPSHNLNLGEVITMQYYIAKTISGGFPAIVERVIESLKVEGFGVLTEIDVKATMKKKLDIDFRDYRILGACNPPLAHQALTADDKIGTMLPCNVIVQDLGGGKIEVAAINPAISMEQVGNPTLKVIAESVTSKLKRVIAAI